MAVGRGRGLTYTWASMPEVDRGGCTLSWEARGPERATPVLMVMGLGLSSRAWGALPERLAERFRVVTFDNRGTGRSTRGRGLYRVADMADDAAAVLEAAGHARAAVFGMSMGGMIALELAARHPSRVRALALGCTFARWLGAAHPAASALADFARVIVKPRGSRATMARLLVSDGFYARDRAAFDAWLARGEHAAIGTALRQVAAVMRHDVSPRLGALSAPTLILSGDRDRLVPVENSRRLARAIPNARLAELRGAGHCFALEQEQEVVRLLSEHFTDN